MAEFQEVMREWTRMCNAVPDGDRNLCSDNESGYVCPLREKGLCSLSTAEQTNEDWAEGEHIIMSWAAEHPEPVYPSWYAWLANMGIVPIELPPDQAIFATDIGLLKKIPAYLAEKLGVEPKEE